MRSKKPKGIHDILKQFVRENKLEESLSEQDVIQYFEQLLPPAVQRNIKGIELRGQKLFVFLESATARHELFYLQNELLTAIQAHSPDKDIQEIVLL
jgi:hypothetical protein